MQHFDPKPDDQRHKVREAELNLARYKRLSRIGLALVIALSLVLLTLVASILWDHPWTQEYIRSVSP